MFYHAKIILVDWETQVLKVRNGASKAERLLTTALWADNSCRQGVPRDAIMGVARETPLTLSTIFSF